METLYNEREIQLVLSHFQIDLREFSSYFLSFESAYEIVSNSINENDYDKENLLNRIETTRKNDTASVVNTIFKADISMYSSLTYYCDKENKSFNSLMEQFNSSNLIKYRDAVISLLATANNYEMDLIEESEEDDYISKPKIIVFEATPNDVTDYLFRKEARMIKDTFSFSESPLYPIIRYGTNVNIFKETCNKFQATIIHFICHGEKDGSLLLLGDVLSYQTFAKYINDEYALNYPGSCIDLCYFNSCYSSVILDNIRNNHSISYIFNYLIGYIGGNNTGYACDFAECFYSLLNVKYPDDNVRCIFDETLLKCSTRDEGWRDYLRSLLLK